MQNIIDPHPLRSLKGGVWSVRLFVAVAVLTLSLSDNAAAQAIKVARPRPRPDLFLFVNLSVTATPSNVNFTLLHGGAATGSSSIAVTTTYLLGANLFGSLTLYGYFSSATSALTGGVPVSSIPSSDVFGLCSTGTPTSYTAFTQTTPFSGASGLQIYSVTTIPALSGSRTDNVSMKIDLTATPQLPAATYTGTVTFVAQSF